MLSALRFLNTFSKELRECEPAPPLATLNGTSLKALVYPRPSARSTLLLVPGIHPSGILDPRLHAFAKACCSAGFQVVAPDIEDFRDLKVTSRSIDQIEELARSLAQNFPPSNLRNTGMLGISYGAGPVFVAASRKTLTDTIKFLVAIGGYGNFQRSIQFATSGIIAGKPPRITQEYGRAIFALNHIDDFLPPESQDKIRQILLHKLPPANEQPAPTMESLSAREEKFVKEIENGFTTELATTNSILQRNEAAWRELSPLNYLQEMNRSTRIYLLHGRSDDLVPFEETEELDRALKSTGFEEIHSLITASLSHVDIQRSRDLWGYVQLLFWLTSVLSESH